MLFPELPDTPADRERAESHLDFIAQQTLSKHSCAVVVGENASGKSLFRQIVKVDGIKKYRRYHASMQLRTASNPSMGALSGLAQDLPWLATSHSTLNCIEQILKQMDNASEPFAVSIDEPETGLGFGAQRGLANWLFPELTKRAKNAVFTLLITHSPIFVQAMPEDWLFLDLSFTPSKSAKEWVSKQTDPSYIVMPEDVLHTAHVMFETVRDRINANESKKS